MKRLAHFCDICGLKKLTLATDRLMAAGLDLCEEHLPKRRKVRSDKGTVRAKGKEYVPWAAREATVLALIPSSGQVSTVELWRQVSRLADAKTMPPGAYKKVMQRLKKKGFVKQHGGRSRTKYERANGRA